MFALFGAFIGCFIVTRVGNMVGNYEQQLLKCPFTNTLLEYAQGDDWRFCQMMGTRSPLVVILTCLRSPLHNFRDGNVFRSI